MIDFYLLELNLYIDTHPNDAYALQKFEDYSKLQKQVAEQYIKKYGPITAKDANTQGAFNWIDEPWPWERGAN